MKFHISKMLAAVAVFVGILSALPASATTVLYRNDGNIGTDRMQAALNSLGLKPTTTTNSLSGYKLSGYDLVVYANQLYTQPSGDASALSSYLSGGGRVIYDNWSRSSTAVPSGAGGYTGNINLNTLTVGSLLDSSLTNPLTLSNPGYASTYSYGVTGSVTAATFNNGDAGIVIGNGGHSIFNGFLTDTLKATQGPRLYTNEINHILAATAVPEPGSVALFGAGLACLAAFRRRTKKA